MSWGTVLVDLLPWSVTSTCSLEDGMLDYPVACLVGQLCCMALAFRHFRAGQYHASVMWFALPLWLPL